MQCEEDLKGHYWLQGILSIQRSNTHPSCLLHWQLIICLQLAKRSSSWVVKVEKGIISMDEKTLKPKMGGREVVEYKRNKQQPSFQKKEVERRGIPRT
ncbi:hypothetical protein CapIbe_016313 [Capra ibex]